MSNGGFQRFFPNRPSERVCRERETHDFRNILPHPPVHQHRYARREAQHESRRCRMLDRQSHP